MNPNLLAKYFVTKNFDIRVTGNGRWIDQKCALDAVCFIADCIIEFIRSEGDRAFNSPEIWKSEYAIKNVQLWFGKPDPLSPSTLDEYNKFFRQPMKMLAASGVLSEKIVGNSIEFRVENQDVLEYIALRERNAYEFLTQYIEKTLIESGLWDSFETFLDEQTKASLESVKNKFSKFCIAFTPINTAVEANRIFIKVLNPLSCKYHKKGIVRGRLSTFNITYDNIVYNKANWRDVLLGKDKNVARADFSGTKPELQMYEYKVSRAAKNLKRFNDEFNSGKSEVTDRFSIGEIATHMHHIFPRNEYPQIAHFIENLIAITSGQHLQRAHPNGKTTIINKDYQYTCLICKTDSIRKNLVEDIDRVPTIYDFNDFMFVLDTGLSSDYFGNLPLNDFASVISGIEINY
jgi:hypothetical protein